MSVRNLFYASYWFSDPHIASPSVLRLWIILLSVCILLGVVALVVRAQATEKLLRTLLQRWSSLLLTVGLVGMVLLFFRQQSAFILSWRVWFLALVVGCMPWFVRLVWYSCKRYPIVKAENAARELKNKYLPESK